MSAARCKERVPDNGDCYSCDNPMPCPRHPAEMVASREAIEEINRILWPALGTRGRNEDSLKLVGRVIDRWRRSAKAIHPQEK